MSLLIEATPLPELIRNYNGQIDGKNLMPGGVDSKSGALWAFQAGYWFFSATIVGTAAVGTFQTGLLIPSGIELVEIRLRVDTAPTGADLIVNVKQNGTAIVTADGRPRILAGTTTQAVVREFTTAPLLARGDYLSFDIDQVGSSVAGGSNTYISGMGRERST